MGRKKTEFEITCCGTVCKGEFLTQFLTECDDVYVDKGGGGGGSIVYGKHTCAQKCRPL